MTIEFLLIQYGLAFVFIWTAVLIFGNVEGWADLLRKSWVRNFLPVEPALIMRGVAVFDVLVGVWLVTGIVLWIPALLAALHLASVLLVTGIMSPVYRDVGLFAMALALFIHSASFV